MPYTVNGKNVMLDALGAVASHVGLMTATAITSVTGEADTDLLTKAGHGLSNGNLVVLTLLGAGEGTGLFNDIPYFVVGVSGDDFQVSHAPAGAAVAFSTDVVSCTVTKYVEISGGSPAYARQATDWDPSDLGILDDNPTDSILFDVPAGAVVDAVANFSAVSGGTCYGIDPVTQETFGGQGTYTLTDEKLNLNGDQVAA